ncbi:hypothetical protein HDU78_007320 [Chytriomyces hyalinus]|nr:hypothetical protein HDU78_007320 [Chytriomyces hyalinus]
MSAGLECDILAGWQPRAFGRNCCSNATIVSCSASGGIVRLDCRSKGLNGPIPTEFARLSSLAYLDLASNDITGTIPTEFGRLSSLTYMDLNDNKLTGAIPSELGQLASLTKIELYDNQLSGIIPTELGRLSRLQSLSLGGTNQISGIIPTELGRLSNLASINVYNNTLTGIIPIQLGQLTSLTRLDLYANKLTGNIPTELGRLVNLQYLSLGINQLTGVIPTELGRLVSLTQMDLVSNAFTGNIPTELGQLASLTYLSLARNQLVGSVPTELGRLTALTDLWMDNNELSGSIPCELSRLKAQNFDFEANQLSGPLGLDELVTYCKSRPTGTFSTTQTPTNSTGTEGTKSPDANNGPNIPMMIGVIIAVILLLGLAVIWYRRSVMANRDKSVPHEQVQPVGSGAGNGESDNHLLISTQPSLTLFPDNEYTKIPKASTLDEVYTAFGNQLQPPVDSYDLIRMVEAQKMEQDARKGNLDNEQGAVVLPATTAAAVLNEHGLLQPSTPFPEDPKEWSQEETAHWIFQKFGNAELRGLIISQKINGLALLRLERQHLVTVLRLETVGEQLVFEGAIEELRNKSARLKALAEGLPLYE